MDWRIVAAALAVIAVLAGGTLLAAQVQTDLDEGIEERVRDTRLDGIEDAPPLKLNDFKLPKSMSLDIPPGTEVSPDLSKLTLPDDMDIQLPEDLDLSDLDFTLPEDFTLELPPGTEFSAPDLHLPEGATIRLPDGREFKIPPGSDITLPPELVQRLLNEGVPAGTLPSGRTIDVRDLPPGLTAQLDPPRFDGKGSLHLPEGTTITLPDGSRFPFPAGTLAYAARYLLPAGTTFDIPFDTTSPGGGFPVPVPYSSSQLVTGRRGSVADGIAVDTEITSMPARVRKGDPVTVSGYVREAVSGRAVAGAPVDVFMNESKRTPGVLVGQGTSDASGTFVVTLVLPTDKPARDYQLVNHAVAFVASDGRAFADGWGDPPFATYASTNITLELPARDGFGAATTLAGSLLDHAGAGVPGVTVVVSSDGSVIGRPVTNVAGRWSLSYTFPSGAHTVTARFAGTANYEASNTASGTIEIEDHAIEIPPVVRAKVGEGIQLSGRVLTKGSIAPDRPVVIDNVFGGDPIELVSDGAGRFSYAFSTSSTQAPGVYVLTYALPEQGVTKTQLVELNQSGTISIEAPASADVESEAPVTVRVRSLGGHAIPSQNLRVTLSGPGGSRDFSGVTDVTGAASFLVAPLRPTPGTYTLSARVVSSPNLDAPTASQTITLGSFEVTWNVPASVVRGQEMSGSATVRFAGRPLVNAAGALGFFRDGGVLAFNDAGGVPVTSDASGVVRFSTVIPTTTSLGTREIALHMDGYATRVTTLQVVAVPKLELDAPASLEPGSEPRASLTLVDDQGDPIRSVPVTLITRFAGEERTTTVMLDPGGKWSGALPLNTSEPGNASVVARFDAKGAYLAGEDVHTMSIAAPRPVLGAAPWWALPLLGVALAGAGGGAWWYVKHKPRRVPVQAVAAAAAPVAIVQRPSDIQLAWGIPAGEPAVWGVGEPIELHARNLAEGGSFELAWGGGSRAITLAEEAAASTTLTFPDEADITITATRQGGEFVPTSASVRIVDYRKETAREFDLFLEKARALDPSLTKRSTPREISWTLEMRLAPEARGHLDEIASVLEVTNYSHYAVSRAHYLRFVHAARALDAFFATPPTQGG